MSLIVSLIGKTKEFEIVDTLNDLNEELKSIGLLDNLLVPQSLSSNIILPWICLRPSDINYLKNLFLEIEYNRSCAYKSDYKKDYLFIGEHVFFEDIAKDIFNEKQSHLLWHSNFCGYYVPIDFKDVLIPNDFLRYIGSSVNLCHELKHISNEIGLDLGSYTPNLELLCKQRIKDFKNDPIEFEKMLILYLYNFCLASLKHNLVIRLG